RFRAKLAVRKKKGAGGRIRCGAAGGWGGAVVADHPAVVALAAPPVAAGPAFRERLTSVLDRGDDEPSSISAVGHAIDSAKNLTDGMAAPLACALSELLRTDEEARQNRVALKSGGRPLPP